ncbi:aldehyde dehydrogenase family protein [Xylanibacillus composti]|uniref:Putative aldehyde dehydrogenase YcbD n=1 Tax=Xylanibacillus composti TaxID=1572762 RepID=A0A8J4M1Q9_9BACL|nr:aldehyde dehydrogenase family protein [Xylanibacillus composti]MDT9727105.1 aldehyde dehydrogenase family protein [Xylanibacillus composti]GIQ68884.1 putative aldehyde dehydrogenase YcbD [Xylanibacillus composti]
MTSKMRDWLDRNSGRTYGNYIDGEWISSSSGATSALYESAMPDRLLGQFACSDQADVDQAVAAAHHAFQTWRLAPPSEKAAILYKFADLLEHHREELAYILSAEQGKVLTESFAEVARAAAEARFAAGEAFRVEGVTLPSDNPLVRSEVVRYPLGVIAAIAPWNFPVVTPVRKLAPAIAYGCTAVLKPASATPWSAVRIIELLAEAGLPKGVVNLVTGSGSQVGDALTEHPLVQGISFTGSTELGLRINQIAAARLARTQLEMGGKNAALVLDYDNLPFAADQIVNAAFACTGQRCTAISRVIVLPSQAERLTELIRERMEALRMAPAWADGAQVGPVINERQFQTVNRYIEIGQQEGADLLCGGERIEVNDPYFAEERQGYFLKPALFANVTKEMRIAQEEIFGPVLSILVAEHTDEALAIANATDYGLAASVFTSSIRTAERMAAELDSGMVHINHGTASQAHVPFGGVKHSGFGAYSIGHTNQEFFTQVKAVYVGR